MKGKRTRGRPRLGMLSELITSSYGEMKREAEDRKKWKSFMPWTCH